MKHTSYVGIDISDSSIRVLRLSDTNTIVAYGSESLGVGVVANGKIVDLEAFSTIINKIFDTTLPHRLDREDGIMRAIVCLPESKLFSHYLQIPRSIHNADIRNYVMEDARTTIPFDLEDLYWDFHVSETGDGRHAVFIGAQKEDVDNYVEALTRARIRPVFVGSELFSLGRAVLPFELGAESHMIVDIGSRSTTIGVFSDDAIANVSVRIPIAGQYFTRKVKESLRLSEEEAESLKRKCGVDMQHEGTGVPAVLRTCMSEILEEVSEAKKFFEEKTGRSVRTVWLAGGSVLMPGIAPYVAERLGIETHVADPLGKITNAEILEQDTPGVLFGTVIGLALLGSNMKIPHINLLTQYQYKDKNVRERFTRLSDVRSIEDIQFVYARLMLRVKKYFQDRSLVHSWKVTIDRKVLLTAAFLILSLSFLGVVIVKYI